MLKLGVTKKINTVNEPPKLAIKAANTIFVLGFLLSVLFMINAIYNIYDPYRNNLTPNFYYIISMFSGFFAILFGLGLSLSNHLKVNLSVLLMTTIICLYTFETYLFFLQKNSKQTRAKQLGITYDARMKAEVIEDLNNSGVEAYLKFIPIFLASLNGLATSNGRIYPLGGISNVTTILDNESGYYPVIETDEHGFNNPKGLYRRGSVDVMLTGDSFTQGSSVYSDENISAVLRKLGFNTISVGEIGNGPLLELAALKEYVKPLQPKVVLWLYFVNDLGDLKIEMNSPILMKYLNEDNFSQNLILRQDEIDATLKNHILQEWNKEKERKRKITIPDNILKLNNIGLKLRIIPEPIIETQGPVPKAVFKHILEKSQKLVSEWGGEMYFVYLPSYIRYAKDGSEILFYEHILQTATDLGIPIIDIQREVFDLHPDPLSLFPLMVKENSQKHYNAEGYNLIAKVISKRLQKDGIISLKPNK